MKTKIFIDFDGTIFNTEKFKDDMFFALRKLGFDEETVMCHYQDECKDKHFSLDGLIERLRAVRKFNVEDIEKQVNQIYSDAPNLIFADFMPFLEKVDREKYEVDILTLGDLEFQKSKVTSSGIVSNFDNIYYTEVDKWDYIKKIISKDEPFILIDDRADTIDKVAKGYSKSTALWIDRKARDKDFDDPTITRKEYNTLKVTNFGQVFDYLEKEE